MTRRRRLTPTLLLPLLVLLACSRPAAPVRVEVGVPETVSRPLLNEFSTDRERGVEARPAAAHAPCRDCDVFWSADLETAMALLRDGAFAALPAGDYGRPPSMLDPQHRWAATSAVARVIAFDPERVSDADAPSAIADLARPVVAHRLVLADPTRGDAAWHAAALFALLGEARALEFYRGLVQNGARVVADEDAVTAALLSGEHPIALTNSDRAFVAQSQRPTLVVSVPDQVASGDGALLLPTVIGITQHGAANPSSHALVDFLLSEPVTRRLAMTSEAILVLEDDAGMPSAPIGIRALRVMPVSYSDLAARLPAVRQALAGLGSSAVAPASVPAGGGPLGRQSAL